MGWAVLGRGVLAAPLQEPARSDVSGLVVSSHDGEPVSYALVKIVSPQRTAFADADGRFRLRRVPPGVYRVRAEQLGYATAELEVTVPRDASVPEPVVFELDPRPIPVEGIAVSAEPVECADPGFPDPETAGYATRILDELRKNLERYRLLIERYPVRIHGEVTKQYLSPGRERAITYVDSSVFILRPDTTPYRPGSLVRVDTIEPGKVWNVTLRRTTHQDLFREAFQRNHCFRYVGTATVRGEVFHRVDFIPVAAIRTADVAGSLYIDGRRFVLRNAVFRAVNFPELPIGPKSFRVAVVYREIYPTFMMPETVEMWIGARNLKHKGLEFDTFLQRYRYLEYEFVGPEPGGDEAGAGEARSNHHE
jgi:hypothetical protein